MPILGPIQLNRHCGFSVQNAKDSPKRNQTQFFSAIWQNCWRAQTKQTLCIPFSRIFESWDHVSFHTSFSHFGWEQVGEEHFAKSSAVFDNSPYISIHGDDCRKHEWHSNLEIEIGFYLEVKRSFFPFPFICCNTLKTKREKPPVPWKDSFLLAPYLSCNGPHAAFTSRNNCHTGGTQTIQVASLKLPPPQGDRYSLS